MADPGHGGLHQRRRRGAIERERTAQRRPRQRRPPPSGELAAGAEWQPFRAAERKHAAERAAGVPARQPDLGPTVFTLQNLQPGWVVVNRTIRMLRDERRPARLRPGIDVSDLELTARGGRDRTLPAGLDPLSAALDHLPAIVRSRWRKWMR